MNNIAKFFTLSVVLFALFGGGCGTGGTEPQNGADSAVSAALASEPSGIKPDTSLPGYGYVWGNNSTSASYTPTAAYSFNSEGYTNTITRSGTGTYRVYFPLTATSGGSVQVSAYGGTGTQRCKTLDWQGVTITPSPNTAVAVDVLCFDSTGAAVDSQYTVFLTNLLFTTTNLYAYVWNDTVSETLNTSYTPNTGYQWNQSNGNITIERTATGTYDVSVPGWTTGAGIAVTTAYGSDATWCVSAGYTASSSPYHFYVDCFSASGTAADSKFTMTVMTENNLVGGTPPHFGYFSGSITSGGVVSGVEWASASGSVTVSNIGTSGNYSVEFVGVGCASTTHVQAHSTSADSHTCLPTSWSCVSSNLTVNLQCTTGERGFEVAYISYLVI